MLHHALLVQRKHSQDPENECFWRKTVMGQPIIQPTHKRLKVKLFKLNRIIGLTITLYDFFQVSRRRAQIFFTFEANFLVFILV